MKCSRGLPASGGRTSKLRIKMESISQGRHGSYRQTYLCITNGETIIIMNPSSFTLITRIIRVIRKIRVNVQEVEEFKL